ncbi:unnamed protein product [Cuscuta europaea]|uniref:SPRY domain-containing protein n=1 Tax=Cuscuta europaea TaxID=41803 RepID=A0A9P1DY82_CUSEU|nr:unnamed protein product [Cuscuta europaea]
MASSERELQPTNEGAGREKPELGVTVTGVQPSFTAPPPRVTLNPADCEIDFDIGCNGLQGSALYQNVFAWCWSGARANVGITGGKYCFGCKIISDQPIHLVDTPPFRNNLCAVGVSRGDDPVGNLGESLHSFFYWATGKTYTGGRSSYYGCRVDYYGESFEVGDTITCCLDLETSDHPLVSFSKNGEWLGVAGNIEDHLIEHPDQQSAFFPHIVLKNVVVRLQFSVEDGLEVVNGYKPWASAIEDGKALPGPSFSDIDDCELRMLVGLPASGKSTWADEWVKEHPEKRYIVLGTGLIYDKIKAHAITNKYNYGERFDEISNTLLPRASKLPRNFILDERNLNKIDRTSKLEQFSNHKKIAVVFFPTFQELQMRCDKQLQEKWSEGDKVSKVPMIPMNEMIVNFSLPTSKDMPCADEYFDEVMFLELGREEAQRCLDAMKAHIHSGLPTNLAPHSRSEEAIDMNPAPAPRYDPGTSSVQPPGGGYAPDREMPPES